MYKYSDTFIKIIFTTKVHLMSLNKIELLNKYVPNYLLPNHITNIYDNMHIVDTSSLKKYLREYIGNEADKINYEHQIIIWDMVPLMTLFDLPIILQIFQKTKNSNITLFIQDYISSIPNHVLCGKSMIGVHMLLMAVLYSNIAIVKNLLELGVNPNITSDKISHFKGCTALIFASRKPLTKTNLSIIKLLLEYGANPNFQELNASNALLNILFQKKYVHSFYDDRFVGSRQYNKIDENTVIAVQFLIEYNIDLNMCCDDKLIYPRSTYLHLVHADIDVMSFLYADICNENTKKIIEMMFGANFKPTNKDKKNWVSMIKY